MKGPSKVCVEGPPVLLMCRTLPVFGVLEETVKTSRNAPHGPVHDVNYGRSQNLWGQPLVVSDVPRLTVLVPVNQFQ